MPALHFPRSVNR